MQDQKFLASERKSVFALSSVLALRMMGLFLIVPIFSIKATEISGATPFLIGVALGIYGLSQAMLQIPFGAASDFFGRKRVLTAALITFAAGSIVAAESSSIYGIILGRLLQGGGAVAAVALAYIGDVTRESQRSKAMAIVGVGIGASFTLSLMLGPVLAQWFDLRGLFWISSIMALIGLVLVWTAVADEPAQHVQNSERHSFQQIKKVFGNTRLIVFSAGSLTIHAVMTAMFLAYPIALIEVANFNAATTWKVFVPVLLLSVIAMIPFIRLSSKMKHTYPLLQVAALILVIAQITLIAGVNMASLVSLIAGLWLFFVGFNVLEALLPSITIGEAPVAHRGTAMGMLSTCTFLGAFIGGVAGGITFELTGSNGVFCFAGFMLCVWYLILYIGKKSNVLYS